MSKCSITKAVILSAGVSKRLAALNLNIPKVMISIDGKTLIERHLESCREAGIREVFINLHYLPETIRNFVGDGSRWGLKVKYSFEDTLLGTSGALHAFSQDLAGEDFLVIYGDNLLEFSLEVVLSEHLKHASIFSIAVFEKEDVSQSGVACLDDQNYILKFIEKPKFDVGSHWVNAGVYAVSSQVLMWIPSGVSDFGFDVIPALIERGEKVLGVKVSGSVTAVDTPELLAKAKAGKVS
jgi:NDP-sugar pyrophosphorylase family protein